MRRIWNVWFCTLLILFSSMEMGLAAAQPVRMAEVTPAVPAGAMNKALLVWKPVPGAVSYQLVVLKQAENMPQNIITVKNSIYAAGYELDLSVMGAEKQNYYWSVCGIDADGAAVGTFSVPQPLCRERMNTTAPQPTTEFDKMDYAPLYPVYSWIPYHGAWSYEVQVWRKGTNGRDQKIRELYQRANNLYDDAGYTVPGTYWWQVRAVGHDELPCSQWSEQRFFSVMAPVKAAALGDSITHGGGAITTPPGYRLYDWESYSSVPIKNLGYSGNRVEDMCERFERDVLPFSPKILVILGGANNFRAGDSAETIIHGLVELREKCLSYGIVPVFAAAPPINPMRMSRTYGMERPADDWLEQQQQINAWILRQTYAVDTASGLTDANGWLRADYTSDGLHPDLPGKKYIGEAIGRYLQQHFAPLLQNH